MVSDPTSLHVYLLQSLLADRERLTDLLEKNPKLMNKLEAVLRQQ
jgi:hypothetical protein